MRLGKPPTHGLEGKNHHSTNTMVESILGDPGGIRTPDPRLRRPDINSPKKPYFMGFAGFENPFGANAGANAVRVRMPC